MLGDLHLGTAGAGNALHLGGSRNAQREVRIQATAPRPSAAILAQADPPIHPVDVFVAWGPPRPRVQAQLVGGLAVTVACDVRPVAPTVRLSATTDAAPPMYQSAPAALRLVVGYVFRVWRGDIEIPHTYDVQLLAEPAPPTNAHWRHGGRLAAGASARTVAAQGAGSCARVSLIPGPRVLGDGEDRWRQSVSALAGAKDVWTGGERLGTPGPWRWIGSAWAAVACQDRWSAGTVRRAALGQRWSSHLVTLRPLREPIQQGADTVLALTEEWREGRHGESPCDRNAWRDGAWVGYVWRQPIPWVPPPKPPRPPRGNDLRLCRRAAGNTLIIGYECERRIPRRRSYHVLHDIAITRLSDGLPVACASITIGLDADAWAWSWSAMALGHDALAAVLPSELGEPVTLVATIDGHTWHLVVEDWQEDRQFGSRSIKISGRGLSAWLGQPFEPAATGTLANARTLHQAMEEFLPLGGGWTIVWADDTPDWLLPAGAWNWQNQAPIQAIHAAAQAVGLVVVPGMADRTLTVQPRYPVLPWQYQTATPDLFIPDAALLSVGRRQAVPTQANAVYVYGGDSGGIIARCWRTGSAGDRTAPAVQSDWITHVDGARLLGARLLAAQEQPPAIRSVTLPLGGVFLLSQIGDLVSFDIDGQDVRGIVNAVSIEAAGNTVRQTLTIGEDTPNVWAMWRRLLPEAPLLLGQVIAVHEDGTRTLELAGGGRMRARGDGAVDSRVWARGGRVEGQAPDFPDYDLELF